MDQDETWRGGRARPRPHCVRWRPCSSTERGTAAPMFRPMSIVAKLSPVSATAELLLLLVLFRYLFSIVVSARDKAFESTLCIVSYRQFECPYIEE